MNYLLYLLRNERGRISQKLLMIIIFGIVFVIAVIGILLLIAAVMAFSYHDQIYSILEKTINFIFGESPDNFLRQLAKDALDNYFKNLFSGEN